MKPTSPSVLLIAWPAGCIRRARRLQQFLRALRSDVTAAASATPEGTASATASASVTPGTDTTVDLPLSADTAIETALAEGARRRGRLRRQHGRGRAAGLVHRGPGQRWFRHRALPQHRPPASSFVRSRRLCRRWPAGRCPKLSAQEGLAAAVEAVPGSEVVEFDLETEERRPSLVRAGPGPLGAGGGLRRTPTPARSSPRSAATDPHRGDKPLATFAGIWGPLRRRRRHPSSTYAGRASCRGPAGPATRNHPRGCWSPPRRAAPV